MRITGISTSPLPPCLRPSRAQSAVRFLQPQPYEQVNLHAHTACSCSCLLLPAALIRLSPAGSGECLEHGYVLNSRYQVVYPFPTFQPAFQLKKDQVVLLNTSYSLVACGISLCPGEAKTQRQRSKKLARMHATLSDCNAKKN